jgi:molybdate transport system permease protein
MDWEAIWLSVRLASLTTLILLVIGLPIAYWVANTQWRFKFMVEAVVSLPMILPPTVLGFYLLIALGAQSPFGRAYEAITGRALPFSFRVYCSPLFCTVFLSRYGLSSRRLPEWNDV